MLYYAEDLMSYKCQNPQCDHTAHGGHEMVFHGACHPYGSIVCNLHYTDDPMVIIHMTCDKCQKRIADVPVKVEDIINYTVPVHMVSACHNSNWEVSFINGVLNFTCLECGSLVYTIGVESADEKNG